MDEIEKSDPVWKLLDNAKPVQISPFFAANVVREVRALGRERREWNLAALLRAWTPVAACIALLVAGVVNLSREPASVATAVAAVPEATVEFDVIADLEFLVAAQDSLLWLDESSLYSY
jgi:hypothetical protein